MRATIAKFTTMLQLVFKSLLALALLLVLALAAVLLFMPGIHISSLAMIANVMTGAGSDITQDKLLQRLQVAPGYSIGVYARGISNPRMLQVTASGRLLVSSPKSGEIIQLSDSNGDGSADDYQILLQGLNRPHGLALHAGYLYVAESDKVGRIAYDDGSGSSRGSYEAVVTGLTDEGNHWSKTIAFDDQQRLYLASGSTCNVCEEDDERRATIMRFDADGDNGQIYASGLRNSVGIAFAPWNGALYATDNGRDLLGDDYPPCELNRIEEGGFYGWPYLNGDNEADPDFGHLGQPLQSAALAPVFDFAAHNAPLGIHFPAGMGRTALVALHGSWNRSYPDGYKVLALHWQDDDKITASDFMWGFESDGNIVGRPVDIAADGRGGFFVSDDYARVIYRISRGEQEQSTALAAPDGGALQDTQPVDPALAAAGATLYAAMSCADCHAEEAATPVMLKALALRYNTRSLADYFLTPTAPMPQYELSAQQRSQLAHYLLAREAGED
jgi:glucose/arabinose dehydrogenase